MEDCFDILPEKRFRTATNCFRVTDFPAIKWFTDASEVRKDSKEDTPTPRSIAIIKLASQVVDAKQVDWPGTSGLCCIMSRILP
jgi:hypothetical protein